MYCTFEQTMGFTDMNYGDMILQPEPRKCSPTSMQDKTVVSQVTGLCLFTNPSSTLTQVLKSTVVNFGPMTSILERTGWSLISTPMVLGDNQAMIWKSSMEIRFTSRPSISSSEPNYGRTVLQTIPRGLYKIHTTVVLQIPVIT